MSNLATIRTFIYSTEYAVAKSYLESYEITCYGQDEFTNRVYFGNVVGGVKLQVKTEDAEEAIRLLMEAGYLKESDLEPTTAIKWIDNVLSKFRNKDN